VGGRSQEIALFDNATHAWNAAFYSVPLRPGDQMLTGRAESGSNVLAYWQAARRTGAEVVVVPNDEYGQLDVAALERLAGERTRLIGVSHVPTSGGLVQPAAAIGRIARGCGALFLLDARPAALSSPPRSTSWRHRRPPRPWPAPESTCRPRCPSTTRWTPRTAASTR
jgi:selenocysteine lyase/cysteine desulfurase